MNAPFKRSCLVAFMALALDPFGQVFAISLAPPTAPTTLRLGPLSPTHRLMNFQYEPRGIFRPPPAPFIMTEIAGGIALGYVAWAISVWQEHPAPLGVCPYTGASPAEQALWQNARAFCTPQQSPYFTRDGRRIFRGLATTDPAKREEDFLEYLAQFQPPHGGKTSPVPDQNRFRLSSVLPPPPSILGMAPAQIDESEWTPISFFQWVKGSDLPKSFGPLSSFLQAQIGLSGIQRIKILRSARDGAVSYRIAIPELTGEPSLLATMNFAEAADGSLTFQSITDLKTRLGTGGVIFFRYLASAAQLPHSVTSIVEGFGNSDRIRLVSNPWVVVAAPEERLIAFAHIDNRLFATKVSDEPGPSVTITAENDGTVATVPVNAPIAELLRTHPEVGKMIERVAGKLFRTSGAFSWSLPEAKPVVNDNPPEAPLPTEAALSPKLQRRLEVLREQLHNKLPFGAPWSVRVEPLASPKSNGVHIAIRGGRNKSKMDLDLYETPGAEGSGTYEILNPKFNITNMHQRKLNPERRAIPLTLEVLRFPVRIVSAVKLVRGLGTILRIRRNEVLLSFESPAPHLNPALTFSESMRRSLADPLIGQKRRMAWRIRLEGLGLSILEETLPVFLTAGGALVSSPESSSGAYVQLRPDGTTWQVEALLSQDERRYLLSDRPLALQALAGLFWSQWDPSVQPLRTLLVSTNPIGPGTTAPLPASFDSTKVWLHRFIEAAANDSTMSSR